MSDKNCSSVQIDKIATDLINGNHHEAVNLLNVCTANVVRASDYGKFMEQNSGKVIEGEPAASATADKLFQTAAREEQALWKNISKVASDKNPAGLCQLTISNGAAGPYPEITGAGCPPF